MFQHSTSRLINSCSTDLVVNRSLWDVIQTLYPQTDATAPPETPLAEQQNFPKITAPTNRSRLGRSTTGSRSFVPPRPVAAAPFVPAATAAARVADSVTLAATTPPAENDHQEIDQLAEALDGLDIVDLTQEINDEIENSEPAAEVTPGGQRSFQPRAAVALPPSRPLQHQQKRALAPVRSTNWIRGHVEVPLPELRPKRVVSGLFYKAAPSRHHQQQQS